MDLSPFKSSSAYTYSNCAFLFLKKDRDKRRNLFSIGIIIFHTSFVYKCSCMDSRTGGYPPLLIRLTLIYYAFGIFGHQENNLSDTACPCFSFRNVFKRNSSFIAVSYIIISLFCTKEKNYIKGNCSVSCHLAYIVCSIFCNETKFYKNNSFFKYFRDNTFYQKPANYSHYLF